MKLAVVGAFSGTHLGGSLARAADALGAETVCFDTAEAARGSRVIGALKWRLVDRQPLRLHHFSASVVEGCARSRPDVLVATGSAALTRSALEALRELKVVCLNFSTDDPWNRTSRSRWHMRALPLYDTVFTPRRANLEDLVALGCPDVRYLPFGYDRRAVSQAKNGGDTPSFDVLFVGGADRDRARFVAEFMRSGPRIALVGGYWERFSATRAQALGLKSAEATRALTAAAKVNLCLVRRANRDGHVMRSFETAAIGACMLVEDTVEHREIFGPDGQCVVYFRDPAGAAARARHLIAEPTERARLADAVRDRIADGQHTYERRLEAILGAALGSSSGSGARDVGQPRC